MKIPDTLEDCFFIALIYLDEFVKRSLMGTYRLYIKFDHWNFNRNLDQRNKELAEQTPLPHHDRT